MKTLVLLIATYPGGHEQRLVFTEAWACQLMKSVILEDGLGTAECFDTGEIYDLTVRPPNRP